MLDDDQRDLAEIRHGDARALGEVLGDLAGKVDLDRDLSALWLRRRRHRQAGGDRRRAVPDRERNYSPDRANLGHARGAAYAAAMAEVYRACFEVLRPGGLLVAVTKNARRWPHGRPRRATVALAPEAGFSYVQHVVALHAAVRDSSSSLGRRSGR